LARRKYFAITMQRVDNDTPLCLDRAVKYFFVGAVLWMGTGCTTLENRRDLYSPDTEFYPTRSTTTVTRQTTTRATREEETSVRLLGK